MGFRKINFLKTFLSPVLIIGLFVSFPILTAAQNIDRDAGVVNESNPQAFLFIGTGEYYKSGFYSFTLTERKNVKIYTCTAGNADASIYIYGSGYSGGNDVTVDGIPGCSINDAYFNDNLGPGTYYISIAARTDYPDYYWEVSTYLSVSAAPCETPNTPTIYSGSSVYLSKTAAKQTIISSTSSVTQIEYSEIVLCSGQSASLFSNYPNSTWLLNGAYFGSGSYITTTQAGYYTAYVGNDCGLTSGISNTIIISAASTPSAPSASVASTLVCNGGTTTGYASDVGGSAYYWYNASGTYIGSGSSIVLGAGSYYVVAASAYGCSSSGASNTITINSGYTPSAPSTSVASTLVCNGGTTTGYASDVGGSAYYWYNTSGTYMGSGSSIALGAGSYYVVAASASGCSNSGASNTITINSGNTPSAPSASVASTLVCNGGTTPGYASDVGGSAYYWYNTSGTYIGSGRSIALGAGSYYVISASPSGCGNSGASNVISIGSAYSPSQPIASATANIVCNGGTTTVTSTDVNGSAYYWYNSGGTHVGTGRTITVGPGSYYVIAASPSGCANSTASNIVSIGSAYSPSQPTASAAANIVCNGGTTTVTSTDVNGSAYYWYNSGGTHVGTGRTVTVGAGSYYVIATSPSGCANSVASNTVHINSGYTPSTPTATAASSVVCSNTATTTITSTDVGGLAYNWYNTNNVYVGTGRTINVGAGSYYVIATSSSGCASSVASNSVTITQVSPLNAPVASTDNLYLCDDKSVVLHASAVNTASVYKWYRSLDRGVTYTFLSVGTEISVNQAGMYRVSVSSSLGCSDSDFSNVLDIKLGIVPTKPVIVASGPLMICKGIPLMLSSNHNLLVSWYLNGQMVGTGSSIIAESGGMYKAFVDGGCGVASDSIKVLTSAALLVKKARFDIIDTKVSGADTAKFNRESKLLINDLIKTSCEGNAELWMSRFETGLEGFSQVKKDELKAALIEICNLGGDFNHPTGASTTPPGKSSSAGYTSLAEAIKGVLGLNVFVTALNPWIIDTPYPFNVKNQATEKYIASTNGSICERLTQLQTKHQTDQPLVSFYQYLLNVYGPAMTLTQNELSSMIKACTNCKYLLPADMILPGFMDPETEGCIGAAEYKLAISELNGLFGDSLVFEDPEYGIIKTNFMNQRWGFSLDFNSYHSFESKIELSPQSVLCNIPVFNTTVERPYSEFDGLVDVGVSNGKHAYTEYIKEERLKFERAYLAICSNIKPNLYVTADQKIYHHTLYYYDQADNLIQTVPPAGVSFLTDQEMVWVNEARNNNPAECLNGYNGPTQNSDKTEILTELSSVLQSKTQQAIEMWLYDQNTSGRFMAGTSDKRVMFQIHRSGSLMSVNIYNLNRVSANESSITLTNKITFNTGTQLHPWTHLVIQSSDFISGELKVYMNGVFLSAVANGEVNGEWALNYKNGQLVLPEDLSSLKHIRFYSRAMTDQEIYANSQNPCFIISPEYDTALRLNLISWMRYNIPQPGAPTTIADTTTTENRYSPIYPSHHLKTSYVYNTLNQVVQQITPDAGNSYFWYDPLGRLTFSQNQKQREEGKLSYTQYDAIGRIIEVGEKKSYNSMPDKPGFLENSTISSISSSGLNSQITKTIYDVKPKGNGIAEDLFQDNLRKRVSASIYMDSQDKPAEQATYYDYDLAGNVKTIHQQIAGLGIKRMDYEYDLVSGKVNALRYQTGANDQFIYKYKYDAENRIVQAHTGTKAIIKPLGGTYLLNGKLDASYQYYLHGPLSRMELGDEQRKVQGVDYAYTLQGWLKGVNGTRLGQVMDIGVDGPNKVVRDALAFSLGYYTGDYKPIGGSAYNAFSNNFQESNQATTGQNLYNGNISSSTYAIAKINDGKTTGYSYGYDQLNRLKAVRQHDLSSSTGNWDYNSASQNFKEDFTYDPNGNILQLMRNAAGGKAIDSLTYNYAKNAGGKILNNRLESVSDPLGVKAGTDIGNSSYGYDPIGNLISDASSAISNIDWNVYGKIKSIEKPEGKITYKYDAGGNRVSKTVEGLTTYYVRDPQGNTLGIYDNAKDSINWREQHLYGSSRLGMWKPNINLAKAGESAQWDTTGLKLLELSNHLGNTQVVITDRRIQSNGYYDADVVNAQDYYAFGMQQPGRSWSLGDGYRYGFNGKENDDDLKGEGNQQDYGMRIYDGRVGRFLSVDPITKQYPELTPYQFASNTPIQAIDLDGLEAFIFHGTWSDPSTYSKLGITTITKITHNATAIKLKWSGYNTDKARQQAGERFANYIMANRDFSQPLTIVGQSHGGSVGMITSNILEQHGFKVDYLITINTPSREYQLKKGAVNKHVQIYQHGDPVQGLAGDKIFIPGFQIIKLPSIHPLMFFSFKGNSMLSGEMGTNVSRTFKDAVNIDVPFSLDFHNSHNTPELWKERLNNAINPKQRQFRFPEIESFKSKRDNTMLKDPELDKLR